MGKSKNLRMATVIWSMWRRHSRKEQNSSGVMSLQASPDQLKVETIGNQVDGSLKVTMAGVRQMNFT